MSVIAVIGGTGYAGRNIVAEAVSRGHRVISISRARPDDPAEGVDYESASLLDPDALLLLVSDADAVIVAASPRGEMAGKLRPAIAALAAALPEGVRLGVVGGAGGSLVAPDGPRLVDTGALPDVIQPEALEMTGVGDDLHDARAGLDWFLVHPAGGFGAQAPGVRTGHYRDGGLVLVTDAEGRSELSGPDLGVAVLDEIESPVHHREEFSVGY